MDSIPRFQKQKKTSLVEDGLTLCLNLFLEIIFQIQNLGHKDNRAHKETRCH